MRPWLLALLALPLLAASSQGQVVYNDGYTLVVGVLVQGEVDDTHEMRPPVGCTDALRPARVTVSMSPLAPTDVLTYLVDFADGPRAGVLTSLAPAATHEGTARDGCITLVTVAGTLVATVLPYQVNDEHLPPG